MRVRCMAVRESHTVADVFLFLLAAVATGELTADLVTGGRALRDVLCGTCQPEAYELMCDTAR